MCAISYIELSILTLHVNKEVQGNDNSVFKRLARIMSLSLTLGQREKPYKI